MQKRFIYIVQIKCTYTQAYTHNIEYKKIKHVRKKKKKLFDF